MQITNHNTSHEINVTQADQIDIKDVWEKVFWPINQFASKFGNVQGRGEPTQ